MSSAGVCRPRGGEVVRGMFAEARRVCGGALRCSPRPRRAGRRLPWSGQRGRSPARGASANGAWPSGTRVHRRSGAGAACRCRLPGPRGAGPARRARSAVVNRRRDGNRRRPEWSAVLHGTTPQERRNDEIRDGKNRPHQCAIPEATDAPPPATKATAVIVTADTAAAIRRPMRMISPWWGTEKGFRVP